MVDVDKFFAFSSVIVKFLVSLCAETQERVSRKQASVTKMVSIVFEACSEVRHGQKDIEIKATLLKHAPPHPAILGTVCEEKAKTHLVLTGWAKTETYDFFSSQLTECPFGANMRGPKGLAVGILAGKRGRAGYHVILYVARETEGRVSCPAPTKAQSRASLPCSVQKGFTAPSRGGTALPNPYQHCECIFLLRLSITDLFKGA